MELPEIIQGQRIILQRAEEHHATALFRRCWSDPVVMRYQDFALQRSLAEAVAYLKCSNKAWNAGEAFFWVIQQIGAEQDEPIGCVLLAKTTPGNYSLGYALGKLFWGMGYVTESIGLLLDVAFVDLDTAIVHGECSRSNNASVRVLEKSGFTRTQAFLNAHDLCNLPPGMARVVDRYTLERNAFLASRLTGQDWPRQHVCLHQA